MSISISTEATLEAPVKYTQMKEMFELLETPTVQYIIQSLMGGEQTSKSLVTTEYKYHTILKYLRKLREISVVRREEVRSETTYKLNYGRLNRINTAIRDL